MWIDIVIFHSSYGCAFTTVRGIWKVLRALSRMLWILIFNAFILKTREAKIIGTFSVMSLFMVCLTDVYYMASSCLGDRKQVQNAQFDSHLTGVKKESFYWRTKTIAHNKGFPRK